MCTAHGSRSFQCQRFTAERSWNWRSYGVYGRWVEAGWMTI